MRIAIGNDHAGVDLKEKIVEFLKCEGHEVTNVGTDTKESIDYPDVARAVAKLVNINECDYGIVICGTGIGISIAANKVLGIRCALCHDCFSAKATRLHNDANMLAMGARVVGPGLAIEIVKNFLATDFSNEERHIRRIKQIED